MWGLLVANGELSRKVLVLCIAPLNMSCHFRMQTSIRHSDVGQWRSHIFQTLKQYRGIVAFTAWPIFLQCCTLLCNFVQHEYMVLLSRDCRDLCPHLLRAHRFKTTHSLEGPACVSQIRLFGALAAVGSRSRLLWRRKRFTVEAYTCVLWLPPFSCKGICCKWTRKRFTGICDLSFHLHSLVCMQFVALAFAISKLLSAQCTLIFAV